MESEESKDVCVNETRRSPLQMPRLFDRLVELPIVKSACEQVSDMYERTKEKSLVSMVGFSAAEVSIKAVLVAAKVTYTALPSTGLVGKLKDSFEEKVSQVDTMACHGLEFLENKWPMIKDDTEKVVAFGTEKLEQSDFVEVLLTVTEAAADYFKPPQEKPTEAATTEPPVIQTKVDRIRGISTIFIDGGEKVLSLAVSVPGRVTLAGIDGAKTVALWSLDFTQSLLHQFPAVEEMLAAFWDHTNNDRFLFRPPIHRDRDGRELLGRKHKLRRSTRYKPKCDYQRIIEASEPFPVSPERKRKYDKEEGEETLIVELINVHEDYVSDEDPDYVPDNDEQDDSESSEDDDTDEEDNEDEGDDDEQAKISDVDETKAKESSPQKAAQSKEAGEEVNGEENISSETETKKEKNIPNKASELNHNAKKEEKKIEAKNSDSEKTENDAAKSAAKSTEKTGAAGKIEGRIIV